MNTCNNNSFNVLTIIPAHAGSKRIARKNTKHLLGIPLIAWSIQSALNSKLEHIIVSTDDKQIADIALKYGAKIPFMRSSVLATDTANIIDVVIGAIDFYQKAGKTFDAVLLLQPTSPFRTVETIKLAIQKFDDGESVVSVSLVDSYPYWCKKVKNGRLVAFDEKYGNTSALRSQDLPVAYQLNGSIYLSSVKNLREKRSFYSENIHALVINSQEEALDIDTPFDWLVAEAIVSKQVGKC